MQFSQALPDRPLRRHLETRDEPPRHKTLICRVTQPRVAAHHNSDVRNVKYKPWCKMQAQAPRSCRDRQWLGRGSPEPGFGSGKTKRRSRWIFRQGQNVGARIEIAKKKPTNKKRPKLSRVMGRPNSPPPGLLTEKIRPIRRSVNSTFVPISWHEQAMSHVALPEPCLQRY